MYFIFQPTLLTESQTQLSNWIYLANRINGGHEENCWLLHSIMIFWRILFKSVFLSPFIPMFFFSRIWNTQVFNRHGRTLCAKFDKLSNSGEVVNIFHMVSEVFYPHIVFVILAYAFKGNALYFGHNLWSCPWNKHKCTTQRNWIFGCGFQVSS